MTTHANGKGVTIMGALHQDQKLQLLTGLCRELSKLGLNVGLSDARPAVVVRNGDAPALWITVIDSGEFFEWAEAVSRHPSADPAGAAASISQYIEAQRPGSGGASP